MAINVKDKLVTLEFLGVAYSAEQDAREEADQALSTRIDNIVAPEGDPSLTEVSDARVSGSTTHNTLKARLDADKAAIETEISGINESLDDVRADVGDLSNLDTTDKSSIVAAINEAAQTGGGGGGGSSTLSGLTDTSISGKADGQVLTYDGTSNKWVNRAPSGGGSVTVDTGLSGTSTNPVQNKIIKQALDSKAGTAVATTSANGLMSATDKSHLDNVYADYSAAIAALGA